MFKCNYHVLFQGKNCLMWRHFPPLQRCLFLSFFSDLIKFLTPSSTTWRGVKIKQNITCWWKFTAVSYNSVTGLSWSGLNETCVAGLYQWSTFPLADPAPQIRKRPVNQNRWNLNHMTGSFDRTQTRGSWLSTPSPHSPLHKHDRELQSATVILSSKCYVLCFYRKDVYTVLNLWLLSC